MTARHYHSETTARDRPPMNDLPDIACRGENPELFFPPDSVHPAGAVKICRRCPHTVMCREWALATDQRWGVYGGTTPGQRARILAKRAEETQ